MREVAGHVERCSERPWKAEAPPPTTSKTNIHRSNDGKKQSARSGGGDDGGDCGDSDDERRDPGLRDEDAEVRAKHPRADTALSRREERGAIRKKEADKRTAAAKERAERKEAS